MVEEGRVVSLSSGKNAKQNSLELLSLFSDKNIIVKALLISLYFILIAKLFCVPSMVLNL